MEKGNNLKGLSFTVIWRDIMRDMEGNLTVIWRVLSDVERYLEVIWRMHSEVEGYHSVVIAFSNMEGGK